MARYPKQDDKGGKNVIPSVTEIISDCTDGTNWAIPYGANQACDWIIEHCNRNVSGATSNPTISYYINDSDLRRKRKDEKKYPDNARYAHKHHSQKALDIGSEVHALIEAYFLTLMRNDCLSVAIMHSFIQESKPEVNNAFNAFLKWKEEHNLKPNALEMTVYSEAGDWAGQLDFFGEFDGKLFVIDWKSGKAFYPEMRYQIAAYRSRMEICDGCGILRLDKTTGLPSWHDTSKSYKQDLRIFNRMADLYFERHPIIRRRARGET